jgi:glycosyltransferase involved in cell wall biosynthesis
MSTFPTVGIVVCTRNRPEALRRALGVVAAQTYPHRKVVVIDDASATAADNRRVVAESGERVEYAINPIALGAAGARNEGIRVVLTLNPDLVCMLDDDDHWPSDRLAWGVRAMGPGVGMSYGVQWMTDEHLCPLFKYPSRTSWTRARLHALLFGEFSFPAKTYMFDARFLDELHATDGTWYADVVSREDVDLGVRALRYAHQTRRWRVVFCKRLFAHWVQPRPDKFFEVDHVRRQQESHARLVQEYLPPWLRPFAQATAPYLIRLPHWLRFAIV